MWVTHGKPCVTMHGKGMPCVTMHGKGMPCVNMHGTFEAYIYRVSNLVCGEEASFSPWEQQGEGGGREKRKGGKEKRRGGKERRKGGKEKKRKEEKRGKKKRKRGKGKRKRKECHAVSKPGQQRTRNCATRGRFPPTLVILRLGAVQWPTGFVRSSERIYMLRGLFVIV